MLSASRSCFNWIVKIITNSYLNQWVMWAACPPCRQDWHHVNQDENSAILLLDAPERPLLLVLLLFCSPEGVPIWTRQMAQRGKGLRHCGHDDICKILFYGIYTYDIYHDQKEWVTSWCITTAHLCLFVKTVYIITNNLLQVEWIIS
jgi:hypothetical protein